MQDAIEDIKSLFDEAKARSEFEFVLTLINYHSIGAAEVQANLHEWFEALNEYIVEYRQSAGKTKARKAALIYSTFFENSDFYNIVGSLCRIKLGYRSSSRLFWKTRKYERLLGIGEKQDYLTDLLGDADKPHIIDFFERNHYPQIRNTYFHSAYSLSGDYYILHDAGSIVINGVSQQNFHVTNFFYPIVENVIALFEAFRDSYNTHFMSYTQTKQIGANPWGKAGEIGGSANGLTGLWVPNVAQFYGEWVSGGIWYSEKDNLWAAKGIRFDMPAIEQLEIADQLKRYEDKTEARSTDIAFFNLIEKVVDRNDPLEIKRAFQLLVNIAEKKYGEMLGEPNQHRKKALPKNILPFYTRALTILTGKGDTKGLVARIKELENIQNS